MPNIIETIRKLLTLSEGSTNVAEAALAAAKARSLLATHSLGLDALDLVSEGAVEAEIVNVRQLAPWRQIVIATCNSLMKTDSYVAAIRQDGKLRQSVRFFGLKANVETALLTYAYLTEAIDAMGSGRSVDRLLRSPSESVSYRLGAALRIRYEAGKHHLLPSPETQALLRVELAAVAEHRRKLQLPPNLSRDLDVDAAAFRLGMADGAKVDPHGARSNRLLKAKTQCP